MVGVPMGKLGLLSPANTGWDPDTPADSPWADPGQLFGFSEL